jgi:ABC-2 type transport system permease protein
MNKKEKENSSIGIQWITAKVFIGEIRESLGDAGAILIFLVAAILYPMLYSVGYVNETINEVPVAVVDLDHTQLSRRYSRLIDVSQQVCITCKPGSLKEAEALFYQGEIHGVILIPKDFERSVLRGSQACVTVYCDAGRFFVYKQVWSAASYVTGTMNAGIEIRSSLTAGKMWDEAVNRFEGLHLQMFDLYNPASGYATFIVPGILIIVIQQSLLVGIGLLLGKYNERRRSHIPLTAGRWPDTFQTLLGRAMAYVSLYLVTTLVTLVLFYRWLSFPERNGFLMVYPLLTLFLFTVVFMGIAVGSLFRKRVHALMFIVYLSPMIFFFSGVAWPAGSMPWIVTVVGYLFPTTPMLPAFLKLRIMGGGYAAIRQEVLVLLIQLAGYFVLAFLATRFSGVFVNCSNNSDDETAGDRTKIPGHTGTMDDH